MSRKKDIVCLDAMIGDLLAQLLFDEPLLDRSVVANTFATVRRAARSEHGYKITSDLSGDYVECDRLQHR